MVKDNLHIIMPVKDSYETTEQAVRAIVASGYSLTIYNDNSTPENSRKLQALVDDLGIRIVHIARHIEHESPNYLWVLIQAEKLALEQDCDLLIIESDVIIRPDTIARLHEQIRPGIGMIAAVTQNESGVINYPYDYALEIQGDIVSTKKRLSFCCTVLTRELLRLYDFNELDPAKSWFDVTISHQSLKMGLENLLMINNPVLHIPHSSRPWKRLKYTNPLLYYWRKLTQHKDRI